MNLKTIGVHGQSVGGLVASNLADLMGLDLLIADRTFTSLARVVYHTFPSVMYYLYCLLTRWDTESSQDYLDANCLKLLIFDNNDKIVSFPSHLKNGITQELTKRL